MPDDVITLGGPGREPRGAAREETLESLFRADYRRLVDAAFALTGDQDLAEELALQAYLRLWRRSWPLLPWGPRFGGGWTRDRQAAWHYLRRMILRLAATGGRRPGLARGRAGAAPGVRAAGGTAGQAADQAPGDAAASGGADGAGAAGGGAASSGADGAGVDEGRAHGAGAGGAGVDEGRAHGAGAGGGGAVSSGADGGGADGAAGGGRELDLRRAWREFERLRSRSVRNARLAAAGSAVAVAVAVTIAFPALAGRHGTHPGAEPSDFRTGQNGSALPPSYPRAVVARIPVSEVISMAADGSRAWAVSTVAGPGGVDSYQLVVINLRTNTVTARVRLGRRPRSVAAADGTVWLTTPYGGGPGQLVRVNPATGRVIKTLHLTAGRCGSIDGTAGYLLANCDVAGPLVTEFLRIDPLTGRVAWQKRAVPGQVGAIAAGPDSVWYAINFLRVSGLVGPTGDSLRAVTTAASSYEGSYTSTLSLTYGGGALWVLGDSEAIVRINPATGTVQRVFTRATVDPANSGGLEKLAAGTGYLWLLADGYPLRGVIQVSPLTGQPLGIVPVAAGVCGQLQPCKQLYVSPGAVWLPTLEQLLRIDPGRMSRREQFPSVLHLRN